MMRTWFFAFEDGKTSFLPCFYLSDPCWLHLLLISRLLSTNYIQCTLFLYLHRPKVLLLPLRKHFSVLKHQRWLVFLSLSLNTFFLPFCVILTCKYIKHTYPVGNYTLNARSTPDCLFLTTKNVPLTFHAVVWSSKHQADLCPNFQTSKYVKRYLACCLFVCK